MAFSSASLPSAIAASSQRIVLAHDALAVANQIFEEVKDLRLEGDQRPAAPQLAPRAVYSKKS
jgi:hypothetical protein